jgi:hypothetical protein
LLEECNAQPIHKNDNRQLKSKYRPIWLLPICGKILEKIVFDQVYAFLNVNDLLIICSQKNNLVLSQVNRRYINYFLSLQLFTKVLKNMMKHVLYPLDIYKAFDKVWYEKVMVYLEASSTFFKLFVKSASAYSFEQ